MTFTLKLFDRRQRTLVSPALVAVLASLSSIGCESSTAACNSLSEAAAKQLESDDLQNLACSTDVDCVNTLVGSYGLCAAPCGVLSSVNGATATASVAESACAAFNAAGCAKPIVECPASSAFLCAGGTCAYYATTLVTSLPSTLKAGVCLSLEIDYSTRGIGSPRTPHDLPVSAQVVNATLYADAACSEPLSVGMSTSDPGEVIITIPAGAERVRFGLRATMPGPGSFTVVGQGVEDQGGSFTVR